MFMKGILRFAQDSNKKYSSFCYLEEQSDEGSPSYQKQSKQKPHDIRGVFVYFLYIPLTKRPFSCILSCYLFLSQTCFKGVFCEIPSHFSLLSFEWMFLQ